MDGDWQIVLPLFGRISGGGGEDRGEVSTDLPQGGVQSSEWLVPVTVQEAVAVEGRAMS